MIVSPLDCPGPAMPEDPHAFMKGAPFAGLPSSGAMPTAPSPAGSVPPDVQKSLDASVARPALSWETPPGWKENQGSGMRLVTFTADGEQGPIECTIVSLGGQAGGLPSNVRRWMQQINAAELSDEQLNEFLSRQAVIKTKDGLPAVVIDLTELSLAAADIRKTAQPPQAPSMMVAVVERENMTVFIKMAGSRQAVADNRERFLSLCRSLTLN